jgi:hypothetical protein
MLYICLVVVSGVNKFVRQKIIDKISCQFRKGKQKQNFCVCYFEGSTPSLTTGYFGFIVN